jgi:hypothetical protein
MVDMHLNLTCLHHTLGVMGGVRLRELRLYIVSILKSNGKNKDRHSISQIPVLSYHGPKVSTYLQAFRPKISLNECA